MRIMPEYYFCPKCKKEYEKFSIMSFYGGMASHADNFVKKNEPITHCSECNRRLVNVGYKKFFNEVGEYIRECRKIEFDVRKIEDFVNEFDWSLGTFEHCCENVSFTVSRIVEIEVGKLEESENKKYIKFEDEKIEIEGFEIRKLNGYCILKGNDGNKEYDLLKVKLASTYNTIYGTRYNPLYLQYLLGQMKLALRCVEDLYERPNGKKVVDLRMGK